MGVPVGWPPVDLVCAARSRVVERHATAAAPSAEQPHAAGFRTCDAMRKYTLLALCSICLLIWYTQGVTPDAVVHFGDIAYAVRDVETKDLQ